MIYKSHSGKNSKIALLSPHNSDKLLVILTGYTPKNDSYNQSPEFFIKNWELDSLGINYLIINFGTSVYYRNDAIKVGEIIKKAIEITKAKRIYNIGVSTGVEGSIKSFYFIENEYKRLFNKFIFISGTYDFRILQENSGEFKIHRISGNVISEENPINFVLALTNKKVYFVSEENSLYFSQLTNLENLYGGYKNFHFVSYRGYSHNWDFWKSKYITNLIFSIVIE